MARPIVKYLDPVSGGYEFATVVDIGDLRNLNTTIKSDIVGAINSIISGGVHNPVNDERIENLETIIDSLKDGTFQIEDFVSIDEHLKQKFLEELDRINAQNREEMQSVLTKLDTSVDDAIRGYQEKVAAQNIILENAENTLVDARGTLEAKAAELETAKIGFSELKTEFDELDGYITTNIRTIDFDNFNAMVEDYETIVTQTSSEVGVDMSGSTLSYLTGRVTDAEANISAQADEITSKMSYDEFQYMPVPKYSYGENLLFDTFDFGDAWSGKNGAQVTPDTFLFGKVAAFNSPTGLYETRTDDLTIGESYVLSTYVNVQPSKKSPSQDKYEPISTSYDPTDFKVQIGGASFNPGIYEDLSGINGWVRINQEFVADAVNPIISITPVGVNSQSEVAYMAMPKVEKGLTVTPWQPHVEDNYATISSTQSMIKQQANSITAFVTEVSELDDSYKQATSTFKMLADGFEANTEAVKNYEDAVIRYGTEYSNINGKFEQKVWKDDFKTAIEDINIDNRNRVLNSDFIRSEISSSDRRLIVEDWSLNSDWEIKTIDNDKYLSRNRTGLTQNLITSASSNYFPVRNGERILFGFDLIHSGLDGDKVFAIELFDISDKRLLKQEFSLSSLAKVGNRYHGSFSISTPGVEKGSVVLQLPKNGSVSFTKILFQNADIGSVDWSPAPEDSWIIQSKLETYISQVEDEVTIGGTGQKLDTLTGLLTEDKGTFTLNPDKIASEVFNSQTYDDMGFVNKTNFEQTADGWMQEITSEGRLAGYINASPDTYRISFDKILLEGTTWADAIGSSKIMVTENFALMGRNGTPVLSVKNDGSINMNITSLKIGEYNALTTNDKSDIESEVADKVINTTKPYVHIAYADTEDGQGLSFNPSGKEYIGFSKSHLPTPSGTASNYEWSKYVGADGPEGPRGLPGDKGPDGQSQWVHIRYSPNSTGSGMTPSPLSTTKYVGIAVTNSATAPAYTGFTWSKYVGEDGSRGPQGLPGQKGDDGTTTYTWIRYADTPTSGMSQYPDGKKYIGMAFNKIVPTESSNYGDYKWSLMPQNIKIGGRNYLLDSYNFTTTGVNADGIVRSITKEGHLKIVASPGNKIYSSDWGMGKSRSLIDENIEDGEMVTFSMEVRSEDSTQMPSFYFGNGMGYLPMEGSVGKEWSRIYSSRPWTAISWSPHIGFGGVSGTFEFRKGKLEKGDVATDWTPATEDVEAAYTAVAQAKAEAERIKAESYADGKVTAEEKARIADAEAKLAAAKKHAEDQILADKKIKDTRNDNQNPSWYFTNYPSQIVREFKNISTMGLSVSGQTYGILTTDVPWTGSSGGAVKQEFKVHTQVFKRSGTSAAWTPWVNYDEIAETAKSIADGAKASASTANSLLTDIASDSKLTATEKKATKKEWDIIVGEKPKIDSSANTYGITTQKTAYNTAYNTLKNYLSGLLSNLNTTSNIVGTTFRANFKAYYDARQDLLNKIADGAKSLVDEIEVGGRNYFTKESPISLKIPGSGFVVRGPETPNGFKITGRNSGDTSIRINNVITSNGWWTVSFDIRGTQTAYVSVSVDINDKGSTTIRTNNTNTYERKSVSVYVDNYSETTYNFVDFDNFGWAHYLIDNIKVEKGNKATDWSPAPEDVQSEVDGKASAEDLTDVSNDLNTAIGDLSNTVDGKVDTSLYEQFLEHNANIQEQLSTSTANAQEDITKALARTATVEQKLGEGAADWIFTHTQIRMSDEGITLGAEGSGSYLQITNDQISFYNGSADPVAFINGGMLNINHAIFVESIQISEFMFSSEISGHLTLRYVGN